MNRTEFIQLIQDPDLPATRHVGALKQVVADFPYFTVSQVLLAKALHNEKHYEYEKYLKQTALTVPDREVLYYYLHNTAAPQAQPVVEYKTPEPAVTPVAEEPAIEIPVVMHEQNIPEAPQDIVAENLVYPEITAEAEMPVMEPVVKEEIPLPEAPDAIPEIMAVPEAQVAETTPQEEEISAPEILAAIPDVIAADEPVTSTEEGVAEIPASQPAEGEEHSFLEWLMMKSGNPVVEPPKARESQPEPALSEPVATPVTEEPATQIPVTVHEPENNEPERPTVEVTKADIEEAVAKSNVNDFGNILDKFIRENPSITRPKAEFFNPVNMAKQSVEEDEELVTETLANLLYKQGNLKKAIRAYEKLCLLYPSKMTYFASLIQKIKTELKD